MKTVNHRFSVSTNGNFSLSREWYFHTPFVNDLTAKVVIANDGAGNAEVKKLIVFDDGQEIELMPDAEFQSRVQAIHEHEDVSMDEARDILDKKDVWSYKLFYGVHGWSPEQVVDDAVLTWQALNMLADLQI